MRLAVFAVLLAIVASSASAQVVISEIMASNNLTLADQDGDYSDWVEIRNLSLSAADISGWYLTDEAGNPTKWQFPTPTLISGFGSRVVFASDKDRAVAGLELHTNYKLASGGEYLGLVQSNGTTIASEFAPSFPPQYTDVSYGIAGSTLGSTVFHTNATPGTPNGSGETVIVDVQHTPPAPTTSDSIVVTAATIAPPGIPVSGMTLRYRVNYGGETAVGMTNTGGTWSATIPSSVTGSSDMVRWRITASNSGAGTPMTPLFLDPNNSPQYLGTAIDDPGVNSQLDTFYWWIQSPSQANTGSGGRCSVSFLGQFYDNVFVRRRGNSSTGWPKKSLKFDFNRGDHLRFDPNEGRVEEINLNSTWGDKSFIRQVLSYDSYDAAGAPGCIVRPWRLQQNGSFYSVVNFVEQPDEDLLSREGLDPNGALYKMFNQMTSSSGGSVEKKTRQWEGNGDLATLVSSVTQSGTALENYLFDNLDIPAVLCYLAATIVMHDNDHVAKNYYLYRDSDGDGEWMFLPWDKDLTWGRNYTLGGGVLNDTIWASSDPYSHPLFGDQAHPKVDGPWNRLIDACYRVPRIREMFLRRLRTVMDEQLQPPSTPSGQLLLTARIAQLQGEMLPDCILDQGSWGVPSYGSSSLNFTNATNQIVSQYLVARRNHLYVNHAGLVPDEQPAGVPISFGAVDPSLGNPDQGYVELRNCTSIAIDLSGWQLVGMVNHIFRPGTVVAAGDSVYVTKDLWSFRIRTTSPTGGEGNFAVGPFTGNLQATGTLQVLNAQGQLAGTWGDFNFSLTTTGAGDLNLLMTGLTPFSQIWLPTSTQTTNPIGCGPLLGVGSDALWVFFLNNNVPPFHVAADFAGIYFYNLPPGTIPPGLTIDARGVSLDAAGWKLSQIRRLTF
ncbi:MAG: hypothetical protein CMJ83_12915 [Planctomycetes bacterium]|nr:hypothetical protein [Planctomycetota bacterium]